MKNLTIVALFALAFAMAPFTSLAEAQQPQYPPVWTDILNLPGYSNMASGNFFSLANGSALQTADNIDLSGIFNTLSMPVSTLPASGGPYTCGGFPGNAGTAVSFIESNVGSGVAGVGFLGTFFAPAGGISSLMFYPNQNFYESVFFNDQPCYNGEREYGFFLVGNNSSVWAYWGTNEGSSPVVQGQLQLSADNNALKNGVTIQPNNEYYFEMYPVPDINNPSNCSFTIVVYTSDNTATPVFQANPSVTDFGAGNILTQDSNFCTSLASATGYVSANIEADPQVTGSLPSSSVLNLNMQRVFVGKD